MKYYQCILLTLIIFFNVSANMITISNEAQYNQEVLLSRTPVVVEFAADWCSVCKGIEKPLQEIAQEQEFAHVTFAQVDIDHLEGISRQNGIVGVPTFMYIEQGKKVNEEVGIQNMAGFKNHLRDNIRNNFKVAQTQEPAQVPSAITQKKSESTQPAAIQQEPQAQQQEEKPKPPVEQEQNWFMQLICYIKMILLTIINKILEAFKALIDTVMGWFGR